MKIALNESLLRFLEDAQRPRISIYFPTELAGPETRQNPIRLKNLVREVRNQLLQEDHSEDAADALLRPINDLIPDFEFWQHQQHGLAILLAGEEMRFYKLPYSVPELALAGYRFHIRPLFPLLTQGGGFRVLSLSQNQVQMFEGNQYSLTRTEVPEMPTNMAEALKLDDGEKSLQFYNYGPNPGGDAAVFHGQGGEKDIHLDQLRRFFQAINKSVRDHYHDSRLPLVLNGVEYLFARYRDINTYPHLLAHGVSGTLESMTEKELHTRAWEIVEPELRVSLHKARQRYELLAHGNSGKEADKTSTEIDDVVLAAYEGRIDALIIPDGKQIWGEIHKDTGKVKTTPSDPSRRRDLIDAAALNTLRHGGEVFVVKPEEMPDGADVAAILRYAAA